MKRKAEVSEEEKCEKVTKESLVVQITGTAESKEEEKLYNRLVKFENKRFVDLLWEVAKPDVVVAFQYKTTAKIINALLMNIPVVIPAWIRDFSVKKWKPKKEHLCPEFEILKQTYATHKNKIINADTMIVIHDSLRTCENGMLYENLITIFDEKRNKVDKFNSFIVITDRTFGNLPGCIGAEAFIKRIVHSDSCIELKPLNFSDICSKLHNIRVEFIDEISEFFYRDFLTTILDQMPTLCYKPSEYIMVIPESYIIGELDHVTESSFFTQLITSEITGTLKCETSFCKAHPRIEEGEKYEICAVCGETTAFVDGVTTFVCGPSCFKIFTSKNKDKTVEQPKENREGISTETSYVAEKEKKEVLEMTPLRKQVLLSYINKLQKKEDIVETFEVIDEFYNNGAKTDVQETIGDKK